MIATIESLIKHIEKMQMELASQRTIKLFELLQVKDEKAKRLAK
jgi:hypothetical protein